MGGVEDDEPPSKRAKVSSITDSMACLLPSQNDGEVIGSRGAINKVEFVRIIAEALYSLGYSKSRACLEEESGILLHSNSVGLFMKQVLDGEWDESISTFREIDPKDESVIKLASFLILEQKFFELLDGKKELGALRTLRTEISPLCLNINRVKELTYSVVRPSKNVSRFKSRNELLEELQKLLPPTVIIPKNRLVHLVEQALDLQKSACRFHNSSVGSLLVDHQCGRDQIPCETLQVNDNNQVFTRHRLSGHESPALCLSWSPDDHQLLTCGICETVKRWDVASGECLRVYHNHFISCAWAADGKSIFCGLADMTIRQLDLEGNELECWEGQRVVMAAELGITADGKELITLVRNNIISFLNRETKSEKFIEETDRISTFTLSGDGKFLLVSLLYKRELHLWNIDGCEKMVSNYRVLRHLSYFGRPCFGGLEQAFIASGSIDSKVNICHRLSGELIATLSGHTGPVNCVSWNPANPHMLASASKDGTMRIWGLKSS